MSGTRLPYETPARACTSISISLRNSPKMFVPAYPISGTRLAYGVPSMGMCYATSATESAYVYAMSSTNLAYAASNVRY
eukprot:3451114-Rhodomonas_salina.5